MALKFLIDECAALPLVDLAHERGFEAYHVVHRGLGGYEDHALLPVLLENEFILVTNNGRDFKGLLADKDTVHPGLVILMTQARPSVQVILFKAVLDHLRDRDNLINRVVEVDVDRATLASLSKTEKLPDAEWERIEKGVKPEVREYALPPAG